MSSTCLRYLRNPLVMALVATGLFLLALSVRTGHALADDCGIHSGDLHDYAGLIVDSKWIDSGGGVHDSNDTRVILSTVTPTDTPAGNIVRIDGDGNLTHRIMADSFSQFNTNGVCTAGMGDGINAVWGAGPTSTASDGTGPSWKLDCDWSLHNDHFQDFDVTGEGVPTGARAGGWWDTTRVAPPNGDTHNREIYYHEPAPSVTNNNNPDGVAIIDCSGASGWAADGDNLNVSIPVVLVELNPDGSIKSTSTITAGDPYPVLNNPPYNWPGNHGFSFPVAVDTSSHIYVVIAVDVNSDGTGADGSRNQVISRLPPDYLTRSAITVGPCRSPKVKNVTPFCDSGKSSVKIEWEDGGPDNNAQGYNIDITDGPDFSGGGWYKYEGNPATTSISFDTLNDSFPPPGSRPQLRLTYGTTTYKVRIYYFASGLHSQEPGLSFKAKNCDRPPVITPTVNCLNPSQGVHIGISDPDGSGYAARYEIDGGSTITILSTSFDIDMSASDQYSPHTVTVHTAGVALPGSVVGPDVTVSVVYGQSPTRGCQDRGFTIVPTGLAKLDDEENPTTASFTTGFTINYTTGSGPGVKLTKIHREYFKIPVGSPGTETPLPPSPLDDTSGSLFNNTNYGPDSRSVSGWVVGDKFCVRITVFPGSGDVDASGNPYNVPPGSQAKLSPPACDTVANKPFFQLKEGDIAAGIPPGCAGWSGGAGTISAWNQLSPSGVGNPNNGAGTNLAAYALNLIDGFASAQSVSGSSPPKDLSFANTTAFGGNYAPGAACPTDYYATGSALIPLGPGAVNVSGGPPGSASSKYTGPISIKGNINPKRRIAVYVDGDAYINGDIQAVGPPGTTPGDLQSFYLIVKGNIYIAPGVTQLDGVYVAQPNGATGGKIYTCASGILLPNVGPSVGELNGTCQANTLTVNGAFIAQELKLYRSKGSVRLAAPAEIFNYSPAVWLAAPDSIGGGKNDYDAITTLPPVL